MEIFLMSAYEVRTRNTEQVQVCRKGKIIFISELTKKINK